MFGVRGERHAHSEHKQPNGWVIVGGYVTVLSSSALALCPPCWTGPRQGVPAPTAEYNRVRQGWSRSSFRPRTSLSAPLTAGPVDGPEEEINCTCALCCTTSHRFIVGVGHSFLRAMWDSSLAYLSMLRLLSIPHRSLLSGHRLWGTGQK